MFQTGYPSGMKRASTMLALVAILMAGFMSVCAADENCAPQAMHTSTHDAPHLHASKAPAKDILKDHCGMLCHVAPYNLPQAQGTPLAATSHNQGRIQGTQATARTNIHTVPEHPPRA